MKPACSEIRLCARVSPVSDESSVNQRVQRRLNLVVRVRISLIELLIEYKSSTYWDVMY